MRKLLITLGLALVGGVASFASTAALSDDDEQPPTAAVPGIDPDDIEFGQCMTVHHAQAVEMSRWALDVSADARPEVTALAARIRDVQVTEIATMRGWLASWGSPPSRMGHDMMLMSGMQNDDAMDTLHDANGESFDTHWLEMMITHHRGGITMSRHAVEDGTDPEVRAAAEAMIAAQTAEIAEMEALLGR